MSTETSNCNLKANYDSYRNSRLDKSNEIIRVSEYKNETVLNNLPYNAIYAFRVIVYDQISQKWSEFSEPSLTELNTRINVNLNVERVGLNALKVNWKQVGTFTNYPISRYNIRVSVNEQPFIDNYDKAYLNMSTIEPVYIEPLMQLTFIGQVKNELECAYACLSFFQCVQYNLNLNSDSCYLATGFDPSKGTKDASTVSKFIRCNLLEFLKLN